jgi:hypothetical protein
MGRYLKWSVSSRAISEVWLVLGIGSTLLLVGVAARLLQPQLLYLMKKSVTSLRVDLLFSGEGGKDKTALFTSLLLRDLRPEGVSSTDTIIDRMSKLRELCRLFEQSSENEIVRREASRAHLCVVELANMAAHLAKDLKTQPSAGSAAVEAKEILQFILGKLGRSYPNNRELEKQLVASPLSLEQIDELFIAVIGAMALRVRGQNAVATKSF